MFLLGADEGKSPQLDRRNKYIKKLLLHHGAKLLTRDEARAAGAGAIRIVVDTDYIKAPLDEHPMCDLNNI